MFAPGKPLQPSVMFAGKAGTYPRVEHLGEVPVNYGYIVNDVDATKSSS